MEIMKNLTPEYLGDNSRWTCEPFLNVYHYINDPFTLAGLHSYQKYLQILLYALVCGIGALGNSLILAAFCFSSNLRTLPNYFIANLALSDLLMCIFSGPFTLTLILNTFWPLGEPACIMVASATALNLFVSTFSLTGIGLHRFALTNFPVKFQHSRLLPICGIILVWGLAILLSLPVAFGAHTLMLTQQISPSRVPWGYTNSSEFQTFLSTTCGLPEPEVCVEDWSHFFLTRQTFSLACFVVQYILPLFTLCLFYWHVGTTAHQRGNFRLRLMRSDDSEGRKQVATTQRRTFLLLCGLVGAFGILWFPWNIYNTLANLALIKFSMISGFVYVYLCGILTATVNPILYGLFNENFRAVFRRLFAIFTKDRGSGLVTAHQFSETDSPSNMIPLINAAKKPGLSDTGYGSSTN